MFYFYFDLELLVDFCSILAGNMLEGDAPDELLRDGITLYVYFWSLQIVFNIAFSEEYESKLCVALYLHFDVNPFVAAEIFHIITSSGKVLKVVLVSQTCEDIVMFSSLTFFGGHNCHFN